MSADALIVVRDAISKAKICEKSLSSGCCFSVVTSSHFLVKREFDEL